METDRSPQEIQAKRAWSRGSYSDIAPNFFSMAAGLVEQTGVDAGETVLDVGCGTGNAAITAAQRGATVTGVDITPTMLEEAVANAALAEIDGVVWVEGTVADLPFDDDRFDVTLSNLGHIFGRPPTSVGRELLRVTKSGGHIGYTCWTPDSAIPAMGAVLAEYLPTERSSGPSPFRWAVPEDARQWIADGLVDLSFRKRSVHVPTFSPTYYWNTTKERAGTFQAALETIDEEDHPDVRSEMIQTIGQYFDERCNGVEMEYQLVSGVVS